MKYPMAWKRLGLSIDSTTGIVSTTKHGPVGTIKPVYRPGTVTPGGMVTETAFVAERSGRAGVELESREFTRKTDAIAFILGEQQ